MSAEVVKQIDKKSNSVFEGVPNSELADLLGRAERHKDKNFKSSIIFEFKRRSGKE